MARKIIQIAVGAATPQVPGRESQPEVFLYALADDGTLWARNLNVQKPKPEWFQQPSLPNS
jgi:hypothetical protein